MIWPVGSQRLVFCTTIAIWIRAAYGQACDRFNTSRIPVVEPSSTYSDVYYFSCADGEFFTSVDVWYGNSVDELRWICSDGDTSHSPEFTHFYYSRVTFDVGITAIETSFISDLYDGSSDLLVFLGDCYIGGYNLSVSPSTSDEEILAWSGPFGTGDSYTAESWTISCPDDSYATGATWWVLSGTGSLNGIQLECAEVTSTCYPPALENQDDDITSIGADDTTDVIDTKESNDTSSGTEVGIIVAAAIGAAVAVLLVAVAVSLCLFRSRRQNAVRAKKTEASQAIEQGNTGALPLPAAAPQISMPSAPEPPPAYMDAPPAYESPQAAPTGPPPQYVSSGHTEAGY